MQENIFVAFFGILKFPDIQGYFSKSVENAFWDISGFSLVSRSGFRLGSFRWQVCVW